MKDTSEAGTATQVMVHQFLLVSFLQYVQTAVLIKRVNNTDNHVGNARFISRLRSL